MREVRRLRKRLAETAPAHEGGDRRQRGSVADMLLRIENERSRLLERRAPTPPAQKSFDAWRSQQLVPVREDYEDPVLEATIRVAGELDLVLGAAYFVAQGGDPAEVEGLLRDMPGTYENLRAELDVLVGRSEGALPESAYDSGTPIPAKTEPSRAGLDLATYREKPQAVRPPDSKSPGAPVPGEESKPDDPAKGSAIKASAIRWMHFASATLGAMGATGAVFSESSMWLFLSAAGAALALVTTAISIESAERDSAKNDSSEKDSEHSSEGAGIVDEEIDPPKMEPPKTRVLTETDSDDDPEDDLPIDKGRSGRHATRKRDE